MITTVPWSLDSQPFLRHAEPAQLSPHKIPKDTSPIGAVVFGSDQGLVGRFNEVIVDLALDTPKKLPGKTKKIFAVGDRVHSLLADANFAPVSLLTVPTSVHGITSVTGQVLIEIQTARDQGDVAEVYLFHNRPKPSVGYEPVCNRLLPFASQWRSKLTAVSWPTKQLPQIVSGSTPALDAFVRGSLFVMLF